MSRPSHSRPRLLLPFAGTLVLCWAVETPAAEPEEKAADRKALQEVWDEIGTPGLRPDRQAETLPKAPEFAPERLKQFPKVGDDNVLRRAARKARAAVWAVAAEAGGGPADFLTEVQQLRQTAGLGLSVLKDGMRAPPNEAKFKEELRTRQLEVARAMGVLDDVYQDLLAAGMRRGRETKRWQANYDLVKARLEVQIAFLYEYQSALGKARIDLPPRDPALHSGWVLESQEKVTGDSAGKKLYKQAQKTFDYIITEYAGTPWEVLARREKERLIGLDWKAVP